VKYADQAITRRTLPTMKITMAALISSDHSPEGTSPVSHIDRKMAITVRIAVTSAGIIMA
jgi:hypothetical protein